MSAERKWRKVTPDMPVFQKEEERRQNGLVIELKQQTTRWAEGYKESLGTQHFRGEKDGVFTYYWENGKYYDRRTGFFIDEKPKLYVEASHFRDGRWQEDTLATEFFVCVCDPGKELFELLSPSDSSKKRPDEAAKSDKQKASIRQQNDVHFEHLKQHGVPDDILQGVKAYLENPPQVSTELSKHRARTGYEGVETIGYFTNKELWVDVVASKPAVPIIEKMEAEKKSKNAVSAPSRFTELSRTGAVPSYEMGW